MMSYFNAFYRTIPLFTGIITAVIGFLVLWGWHTNNPSLTYFNPSFSMMNYNAALCFVAAGIGVILLIKNNRKLTFLLGAFIIVVSYLTVAEHLFKIDMGIDNLILHELTGKPQSSENRIFPLAAILLSLIGTSILILSNFVVMNLQRKILYFGLIVLNLIILMMSFSALFGYIVDLPENYRWEQTFRMGIHSAVATFLLAIGVIVILYKKTVENDISFGYSVPWFVFFGVEVLTLSFWQASSAYVEKNVVQQNLVAADGIKSIVREELESRTEALARMASRWEGRRGGTPYREWARDAANTIKDQPGYESIGWLDSKFAVRWVESLKGNKAKQDLKVYENGAIAQTLLEAVRSGTTKISPMVSLGSNEKGFLIYAPIGKGNNFSGVIRGVINAKLFFTEILHDAVKNYNVAVYNENKVAYQLYPMFGTPHLNPDFSHGKSNQNWSIISWPLPAQAKKLQSWLPTSVLVIGFIIALMLSIITHMAQVARRLAYKAQEEIMMRQRTEKKLIVYSKKLKKQSILDTLTGTNNRRGLNAMLQGEIDQLHVSENNLSVILLDIDHFKKINDTYGHVIGDKVLQRVSNILKKNVRSTDTVARYGGEEFFIILNHTNDTQAYEVAEKLRGILSKEPFYDENKKPFHLTCSFGVYQVPKGAKKINDVFQVVDTALYTAKNSGRNCVILV